MWSGAVTFGLVSVPVKLFAAVKQKSVRFHLLHDKDGARVREKRVCSAEGTEVSYEHLIKGFELSRGRYVPVKPEELEALDPKATRTIDIEDFVALDEIDPIYYQHSYYLVPDRGGAKPYSLLLETMRRLNKVAIARVVLRTKQYLCALRPMERALMLSTMLYADEVVAPSVLEGLPAASSRPRERELQMAEQLVRSLVTDFDPKKYHDDYRERVLELIERKSEGEEIVATEEEPAPARVVDLMQALKESLKASGKEPTRAAPKRRAPARERSHRARRTHRKSA